jgi:alkanesulfonate monooxygenase SsuD/methylene tetrahydromethanopterin reductase-like flavin-dependent oxidoreductase (luciferase family)
MRFAVDIPNIGTFGGQGSDFADPRFVAELAHEAEQAGWDGFFIWDHIGADWPVAIADPWVLLAAAAMRTSAIKLGPMVTPLARRRPWKLARETVTLDHLSQGRLIVGVGLGGGDEFARFGEPGDDRDHGAMLDEGLAVLAGLWSGERFSYAGAHYRVDGAHFLPKPVQTRIPVWAAALWPNKKPVRRAAALDGLFPIGKTLNFLQQMAPADMRAARDYALAHRPADAGPFDLVHWGITAGTDPGADRALAEEYAAAGVTWWLENFSNDRGTAEEQRERIRRGPPRLDCSKAQLD